MASDWNRHPFNPSKNLNFQKVDQKKNVKKTFMIGLKLHGILVVLPQKNPPVVIPPPGWTNGWWNVPRFPEPPETQCRPNVDQCRNQLQKLGIGMENPGKNGDLSTNHYEIWRISGSNVYLVDKNILASPQNTSEKLQKKTKYMYLF